LFSGGPSEQRAILKHQVAASMFLNLSIKDSDKMTVTEFRSIRELANEIKNEMSKDTGHTATPGTLGQARIM